MHIPSMSTALDASATKMVMAESNLSGIPSLQQGQEKRERRACELVEFRRRRCRLCTHAPAHACEAWDVQRLLAAWQEATKLVGALGEEVAALLQDLQDTIICQQKSTARHTYKKERARVLVHVGV